MTLRTLTSEEKQAIASLRRLAKRWPSSLWLASMAGRLHVMSTSPDGERMYHPVNRDGSGGGLDQRYSLGVIEIPNDGGDW